eukprot:scaffold106541_cov45-Phaeocystis_antarctica.AAC.1
MQIDLGGVHGEKIDSLDLAKFCSSDGGCLQNDTEYQLDIFHCERNTYTSNFKMTTVGIELFTVGRPPPPSPSPPPPSPSPPPPSPSPPPPSPSPPP